MPDRFGNITPSEQERILSRLEKKYDKDSEPYRTYYSDMEDIKTLKQLGRIDKLHAELLAEQANKLFESKVKKPSEQIHIEPNLSMGEMVDIVQDGIGALIKLPLYLIGIMMCLWFLIKIVF